MTSGGDSAGMNPAIKRVVDSAIEHGVDAYVVKEGLRGLIDNRIVLADRATVSGILSRGGTVIGSSRSQRFREPAYRAAAYENLQAHGIDMLVVIGGDGSFRAGNVISEESGVRVAGIPATIDNDIACTDYCLGVDTALNVIRRAIDDIRDTASSFGRAFVVETMGRNCGYLAAMTGLTSGAELVLLPEIGYDLDTAARRINEEVSKGRRYAIGVVAEGVGMTAEIVQWFEAKIGLEARATILGHIQRGGSPTVFDRRMGFLFATAAVEALMQGQTGVVTVSRGGKVGLETFKQVTETRYEMDPYILKMVERLTR